MKKIRRKRRKENTKRSLLVQGSGKACLKAYEPKVAGNKVAYPKLQWQAI